MKLALCLFRYFPYGGLQRNFLTIGQELVRRGHEVVIYTGAWEGDRPKELSIKILPVSGYSNHAKNRHFHQHLQRALAASPVDLVVGFNKMPGLDVYYCADTCFATKAYEDKNIWYRMTSRCRWSLRYERSVFGVDTSTEVLLLSEQEGKAFKKYYGTDDRRLHLMPPGISRNRVRDELSDTKRALTRNELDVDEQGKVIAFVGSDYKRKGLDRLLTAFSSLPPGEQRLNRIIVIGRDKHQPAYEKLAAKLSILDRVTFLGQRDDVPDLLFASDYLAHPAYLENTGNVLLEGVVAGLPVICTAICGYSFYIEQNQLGEVVAEPFKQTSMNSQLQQLLNSQQDWRRHCAEFAASADIYSRPERAAETIEAIGAG
ncbi:MAG: glycosyltransferase family 4 protein [Oceanicoccus sp.]